MSARSESDSPAEQDRVVRENNFDILRLLFAALVIFSHSPQLIHGDNAPEEPLIGLFGTITLGELAVGGFFLISGYLITESYRRSGSTRAYLVKRVLRIYPGYLVAFFASIYVFGRLGGGDPPVSPAGVLKLLAAALALHTPEVPGTFAGLPVPVVNGSMWTIAYEFRCYLLVIVLGTLGLLFRRSVMTGLTVLALALTVLGFGPEVPHVVSIITGGIALVVPFVAFFCTGILFLLYGGRIPYRPFLAAAAALALCGCLFVPDLARAGAAVFGGYLVFWFALAVRSPLIDRLRPRQDISYGLYLYGWPVQSLIIFWFRDLSAFQVSLLTLVVAGLFGWLSWVLVESPALRLKRTGLARHGLARKS